MKRDYKDGIGEQVTFFTGVEVEYTPAYGKKTLFVVGLQNPSTIVDMATQYQCDHIYLGANHSFDGMNIMTWETSIRALLDTGLWVTLDFDIKLYDSILDLLVSTCEYDRFITQISVKLPYLSNLNYHSCIKIDDNGFRSTNPGVWVHQLHDLMDRSKFTDWTQYKKDEIIK